MSGYAILACSYIFICMINAFRPCYPRPSLPLSNAARGRSSACLHLHCNLHLHHSHFSLRLLLTHSPTPLSSPPPHPPSRQVQLHFACVNINTDGRPASPSSTITITHLRPPTHSSAE
ncbi:hypothetical protein DFH27DRAFT_335453 [Peziza echinospora]|nr:hypothetical protein DFH27DRAFT_335453 [Peziza echinospora]